MLRLATSSQKSGVTRTTSSIEKTARLSSAEIQAQAFCSKRIGTATGLIIEMEGQLASDAIRLTVASCLRHGTTMESGIVPTARPSFNGILRRVRLSMRSIGKLACISLRIKVGP